MTNQKPNPCNCSTCLHKDNDWCEKLNRILRWHEVGLISELGCASHSQVREWLMKDVIEELERLYQSALRVNDIGAYCIYDEVIVIIRDGVKKL